MRKQSETYNICQPSAAGKADGCAFADEVTNYVCECNRAFNAETLHPLVSLIDMSAPSEGQHIKTDCYAIVFKHRAEDGEKYGRRYYDYTDGTVMFITPSKEVDLTTNDGKMLIFHPDLITCTPLGMKLKDYTFFKYRQEESLHISACEERVIKRCLAAISDELCWGIDEYSKTILCTSIELLLNYCNRFYTRQFITRHDADTATIADIEKDIDHSLLSGQAATKGMPTAGRLAPRYGMSAEYLNDMLKNETGKTVSEYVQLRRLLMARRLLMDNSKTIDEISDLLGFCTTGCFATVFQKTTGKTPEEYRKL